MKTIALVLLLCLIPLTSLKALELGKYVSLSGFGTLGTLGSDTNQIGFLRDRSQAHAIYDSWGVTTDSRLGLQLDAKISDSVQATLQWIARDHAGDFFEQNLEWAFLRWSITPNTDLRVGRLGADLFLLSDYRNVGYAYSWMRPPTEFYGNLPMYHFDGLDISHKLKIGEDKLTLKWFSGLTHNRLPTFFNQMFDADLFGTGGNAIYESGNWRSRIGYSFLQVVSEIPNQELDTALNDPILNILMPDIRSIIPKLSIKNTNANFFSIGTVYDDGVWLAQAEAQYLKTQTTLFPNTASGYLSLGRRFAEITLYSMYGIAYTFNQKTAIPNPIVAIPKLQELHQVLDGAINQNGIHQQSLSIGARWDVHPKIALKTEWSHYWLGSNGTELWQEPASGNMPQQTNVWSVGVDFIF